jgi:hypothetical protein
MSNMKDYMMWLDDKGIAKWDNTLGELIIPKGTNIYAEELMEWYHDDAAWHRPHGPHDDDDEAAVNDDEEDDGFLDDDDLGDFYMKVGTLSDLIDKLFDGTQLSTQFQETLDTDTLTRLWNIKADLDSIYEDQIDMGWTPEEYWIDGEGGMTADAQNYLHALDSRGELI